MAIANFYTFSKRKNSTKQPTGSGTQLDVNLKSGTSLLSPTFLLSLSSRPAYNYMQFEGRYYFIKDIISVRDNLWEVVGDIDALATIKNDILATTAYVLFDSVANVELIDNRLPLKTTKTVQVNSVACPFVPDGGCYILSLTGSNDTTGVYKVDELELQSLIDDITYLFNNLYDFSNEPQFTPPTSGNVFDALITAWENGIDWFKWLLYQVLVNPIAQFFGSGSIPENIRECRYIPFNVGVSGTPILIHLGTFQTRVSLGKLVTETVHREVTINIPWQANDYRRRPPYTDLYIYLPYIGMIKLSTENLIGEASITVGYTLAMRDGSLICTLTSGGEVIGQYSGNVGAEVPIGVSNINLPKAAQSVFSGAANAANKNFAGVGMAGINFGDAITPNFTCIGGLEGIAAIGANQNIICYSVFHDTVVPPNQNLQTIGAPSMCSKSLSNLTGYCQCSDAHVNSAELSSIVDIADGFLNSGFFIE